MNWLNVVSSPFSKFDTMEVSLDQGALTIQFIYVGESLAHCKNLLERICKTRYSSDEPVATTGSEEADNIALHAWEKKLRTLL